jgi:hypothetical protein
MTWKWHSSLQYTSTRTGSADANTHAAVRLISLDLKGAWGVYIIEDGSTPPLQYPRSHLKDLRREKSAAADFQLKKRPQWVKTYRSPGKYPASSEKPLKFPVSSGN